MALETATAPNSDLTIASNHESTAQIASAFADDLTVESTTPDPIETPAAPVEEPSGDFVSTNDSALENETPVIAAEIEKPKRTRRNDPAEAVKSAIAKQREAERRAEAAEARIQAMTQPVDDPQPGGGSWERFKEIPGVPTVDQFNTYEDYSMALAAFVADVRQHERDAERSQQEQAYRVQQAQQAQAQVWFGRLAEARTANPQFDTTIDPETPMSLPMQHLVMKSDHGVQLLQWLSANPEHAQRLSTLHPADTCYEMGKLEARFEAAPSRASAQTVSNAKSPIRPLGTSPHVPDANAITDDLSVEEHFRRMNASDRARGRL